MSAAVVSGELWAIYSSPLKCPKSEAYDPKMMPKIKDSQLLKEHLSLQKELLEKSIEAMHIDGEPFDPLS